MTVAEQDAQAIKEGDYNKHSQRWLGPSTDIRKRRQPLSNECLAALREGAAAAGGRPLTYAERDAIVKKFQ